MADRPLGISLMCGLFGLLGLGFLIGGLALLGELRGVNLAQAPQSVGLFMIITPFFVMGLGILGIHTAFTLWHASPRGRLGGLVWIGLWAAQELVVGIWAVTGPDIVQQASGDIGDNLLRILIATFLFYYLWTVGGTYVDDNRTDEAVTASANEG